MLNGTIVIDEARCKGCGLCITVCPQQVIRVNTRFFNAKGYHPVELSESDGCCTGCGVCAVMCPDVAITVYREKATHPKSAIREVV